MIIQNKELTIRNATITDVPILGRWWRDGVVMAHAGYPNGLDITDEQIAVDLTHDSDEHHRRLIIEADDIPIGEMNYRNKGESIAEIGIKICDSTKQEIGYGTRLLRMLINALFCEQGFEKIILDTNAHNTRAQHVYEKIGFRKLGVRTVPWFDQFGQRQSSIDYELTKVDFFNI